jgi:hypothetical protein
MRPGLEIVLATGDKVRHGELFSDEVIGRQLVDS